ncbi:MAG: HAD-IC family P-type ATPase [Candidatus Pacebacteria bacterium]|nr:HAD-IC family P-type ATPase [Candidatus Paceibacterota bacterium]
MAKTTLSQEEQAQILEINNQLSADGLRVLAIGQKKIKAGVKDGDEKEVGIRGGFGAKVSDQTAAKARANSKSKTATSQTMSAALQKTPAPEKTSAASETMSAALQKTPAASETMSAAPQTAEDLDQVGDFQFLGLVAMYDPPRQEVPQALNFCHRAGIRVMMITGDHKKTALAIAQEVGLDTIGAYTGNELDNMDDAYLTKVVKEANVFARVSPRHKVLILKKLKELGFQVAMTGDGVNDAPAIKRADVGIAVADGTDLTKGVADMVLLDNNFSTIADGIHEGRKIFFNIKKFVRFLLSANFDEIARALTSIVLHLPLSLLPIHILWLNLVTDSFPALALTVDEADPNIMDKEPYNPKKEILRGVLSYSIAAALIGYLVIYGLFLLYLFSFGASETYARTVSFTATVLFELILVFSIRTEAPTKLKELFSNTWLWLAVMAGALAQLWTVYHPWGQLIFETQPIRPIDWLIIFGASTSGFIGIELLKRMKVLK